MKLIETAFLAVVCAMPALSDIVLENDAFKLVVGDDARAKSLVVKATGEETLDNGEGLPLFSVTQERPFNIDFDKSATDREILKRKLKGQI